MTTAPSTKEESSMAALSLQNIHLLLPRLMMPLVFGIEIIARDTIKCSSYLRVLRARLRVCA